MKTWESKRERECTLQMPTATRTQQDEDECASVFLGTQRTQQDEDEGIRIFAFTGNPTRDFCVRRRMGQKMKMKARPYLPNVNRVYL